ncbi:hypothetical protein SERLA73DRAFT_187817 [Serpula lacrymans var. lacrymans S7.3]|uniref:Uncharacterized protein n=2 Tax=Serpula lacrymans var. lacrymans TaxID=341189 RepID=F8QAH1_SERL3|nr:uncharacterized protein SERLADRAFT_477626 [Serpula lacrymans var. lacrymans S7.9]EGN94761.1 hypothetical protein SERLA73DRAFT_187817 [Serpula lacrymans var. lacrymans S7.3]EGO20238.1 hypothetical protein SERLADRAFT_477626 [Serpula lacrymans var. lacrymans S7.9]
MSIDKTLRELQPRIMIMTSLFPSASVSYQQWVDFQQRWRMCLRHSCKVAAENVHILRRFDTVYLARVENIRTEQDRIAAIQALESFIDELEKNDNSVQMSQEFLTLKRDIADFIGKFTHQASDLATQLLKSIALLEDQIKSALRTIAIIGGGLLEGLGSGTRASRVAASLNTQRDKEAESFRDVQLMLATLNTLEAPHLQSQLRGHQHEEPNISLMLERLVVFAEIWSSVRSQAVQFREHLKGGMKASTNMRFKNEVKVARAVCKPLMEGLAEFKARLEGWIFK